LAAGVAAVQLKLSDLTIEGSDRLAKVDEALAKFDASEPRDRRGRWTIGGAGDASAQSVPYDPTSPAGGVSSLRHARFIADNPPMGGNPTTVEPKADLSEAAIDRKVLEVLARTPAAVAAGYRVNPSTGQLERRTLLGAPADPTAYKPVSPSGVQAFKERFLNADSYRPGVASPQEQRLRSQIVTQAGLFGGDAGGGIGPHNYHPKPGDAALLARLIFSESAETPGDYAAIGWAAANRVNTRYYGATLHDIIHQSGAFQCVTDNKASLWVQSLAPNRFTGLNAQNWPKAVAAANGILGGAIPDPTDGATTFFSSDTYRSPADKDSAPGTFGRRIGRTLSPSPYESSSPGPNRQFFFVENPPQKTRRSRK
jgi:hypothetical protein